MTDHIYQEFYKIFSELNNFKQHKCGTEFEYVIPNNNNKYYILVCSVQNFKGIHAIHYSHFNTNSMIDNKLSNTTTPMQFSIELDITNPLFKKCNGFMFEGYLYESKELGKPYNYYISDILYIKKQGSLLSIPYELRYLNILNLFNDNFDLFNNVDLTLNLNPCNIFPKTMFTEFLVQNHIHKSEITHIEYILNHLYSKKNLPIDISPQTDSQFKVLVKTDKTEVIEVKNKDTNNHEGILYIKNKDISHYIRNELKQKDHLLIQCIFNSKFNKWEPILTSIN